MNHERQVRITKRFTFEMAHALRAHDGPCQHIHGHSYVLDVTVRGIPLARANDSKNGMIIDFTELRSIVQRCVLNVYDHALILHETEREGIPMQLPMFGRTHFTPWQPTCEHLLLDMVARIKNELPNTLSLHQARLQETATSWAEWQA